jgi:hypothetical protein
MPMALYGARTGLPQHPDEDRPLFLPVGPIPPPSRHRTAHIALL